MTIVLPGHNFPYWSAPGTTAAPALIIGAGLSTPMVPLPACLCQEYAAKQAQIEANLSISTGYTFTGAADDLYQWSEVCVQKIVDATGATEGTAKQQLLAELDISSDERFSANASVPIRGTTPRHRVLARLAREGSIHSMWSLNWDLWLEAAFEAVGINRNGKPATWASSKLPAAWVTKYEVWLPTIEPAPPTASQTITLYKPHGCVQALYERTNDTFRITAKELKEPAASCVSKRLEAQVCEKPVVAIGWGATEGNLMDVFEECHSAQTLTGGLTVVGLEWNDGGGTNGNGHKKLAGFFQQEESATLCKVKKTGWGTTDDLMQWIQALRSLCRFHDGAKAVCSHEPLLQLLQTHIATFSQPVFSTHPLGWALSWFDSFFPVWSRLCFSVGAVVFRRDGDVPSHAIPLVLRDAHIPLVDGTTNRFDLASAAWMYSEIDAGGLGAQLDFESYPGAFWMPTVRTLLVPVPLWACAESISLAALKPLVESRHWGNLNRVEKVCLVGIDYHSPNKGPDLDSSSTAGWKQTFCSLMKLGAHAQPAQLDFIELHQLVSYLDNRKDAQ
jgi:hypothetical protein